MIWSALWNNLSIVGVSQTSNKKERDQAILLNRFILLTFIPIILSLIIYAINNNWLMFSNVVFGGVICFLVLFLTAYFGKDVGWHVGIITGIGFLILQSLFVKSIFSISIILCSFTLMVNYIYLKSKIKYLYYFLILIAMIIVLVNPRLSVSSNIAEAYEINIIYGLVGLSFQVFFSMLYSRQVKIRDVEISNKEAEIESLLAELQEKKSNLEKIVAERTKRLNGLNEELRRSNIDLNQFAFSASHDLKEPLRTIASFLKLLEKRSGEHIDAEGKEYLNYAVDGAKRMSDLIHDLLEYSQVGTRSAKVKTSNFNSILERKLLDLNKKIIEKNAIIIYDGLPECFSCVPNQIGILMYNLVNNALKFNQSEQPTIIVKGKERKEDWLIAVADNGIGILEKDKEKIFEVFNRLHTKSEYEGSGIGLAVCKKIVTRHQGKIWLESTKNNGTTFFFTIQKVVTPVELELEVA